MFNQLLDIETLLPELLQQESIWKSVFVDYHLPYVERLWTSITLNNQEYRIYLHRILPCNLEDCLFHPHPWPSIIKILSGEYIMQVGWGEGMKEPEIATTLILPTNTIYEMTNINAWHAVSPMKEASFSLMITGQPWDRESHKSTKILSPLNEEQKNNLLLFFKNKYYLHINA